MNVGISRDGLVPVIRRWKWAAPLAGSLIILFMPAFGASLEIQRDLLLIAIYTLIVSGLNLSFGFAGELALGQVATFAAGAYATAILSVHGQNDIVLAMAVSVVVAGIVGLITGIPGLRLSHWTLGMVSFFMVVLVPNIVEVFSSFTGGLVGLTGVIGPTLFGLHLTQAGFYAVVVVSCVVWLYIVRNLIASRYGLALMSLRVSSELVDSLGSSVYKLRVSAYVVGGIPAGIAGCLYAYLIGYIAPTMFTFSLAIAVLAGSIVGGSASIWGAPVGATLLVLGPLNTAGFARWSLLVYGAFLLLIGVLFGGGIAGLLRRGMNSLLPGWQASPDADSAVADAGPEGASPLAGIAGERLQITDVAKDFGGNHALTGVTLDAEPGKITALIGPNGAGKTTVLNVISGLVPVSRGEVRLGGSRITNFSPSRIARLKVARTFQTPQIPDGLTVSEVVQSGRIGASLQPISAVVRAPRFWRTQREDRAVAMTLLRRAGLADRAQRVAATMPLGVRRLLEVLRAAAVQPALILLDEPAAGLDERGVAELEALIRWLSRSGSTVILVEHNVPFVLRVADQVHVMHLGQVIASGPPEVIQRDAKVIESYLGARMSRRLQRTAPVPQSQEADK